MADSDLAELRKQCITSLYLCTDNVSKYIDTEQETEFNKLKSYVEGYCLLEAQQEVAIQALERAKKETDTSNIDSLENCFEAHLASLAGKRLDVKKHPYMTELNKRIDKGLQNARQNLEESDLAITETQDQYIDPITKRPIVDPVKNSLCGHIYEKESIINLITIKQRTKCPVVGCGNREPVQRQHLISDDELLFRMALTQHSTMIQEKSVMNLDDTN
ncbi:E3 SUMO-protein ligase NSE2-like [Hyposmocoma kahamanoa]|uniref:E3 SUMO-protein ligase NSE2-like n=1 Tax=Hyposmocoma kahamanoa TaxID=1477025 RepID=UPI000E6D7A70|nr:E3 SUMO-protein ligase NSE2-like [Hyposmocoma kahamanoa]